MSPARAVTMLAMLLAASASLAPASAAASVGCAASDGEPQTLRWDYTVAFDPERPGSVRVELRLRDMACLVTSFSFLTEGPAGRATHVAPLDGVETRLRFEEGGFAFDVDSDEEGFSYELDVDEPAFRRGEMLAMAGRSFALFKAESLQLTFRYSYYEGIPFRNETTVRFSLPPGWGAASPWNVTADGVHHLDDDSVQPRGYIVAAPGLEAHARVLAGTTFRYVRLGAQAPFEARMWDYLENATRYYGAVYGAPPGGPVLVVNAPDPMFRGGLAGAGSLFVHDSVDVRTLAHEYAHVHQRFSTVETPPGSALWLHEGDADYASALSLHAAGYWTAADVDAFLRHARAAKDDPLFAQARLPDAGYGGVLERFAYLKGSVVARALDEQLRAGTGGKVGLAHVMQRLNLDAQADDEARIDNARARRVAEEVSGLDLSDFFARFVEGTEWPETAPFVPEGQFSIGPLELDPPVARPGESVRASATVANLGTRTATRTVTLRLDGDAIDQRNLTLPVGAAMRLDFHFEAPAPGYREVAVGYQHATLQSLLPASVHLARASHAPATLRIEEEAMLLVFLENHGDENGTARIEVFEGTRRVASTGEVILDGGDARAEALSYTPSAPGKHDLEVRLETPRGNETLPFVVEVEGALPGSARGEPGAVGQAARGIPAPGWLALVAVALATRGFRKR